MSASNGTSSQSKGNPIVASVFFSGSGLLRPNPAIPLYKRTLDSSADAIHQLKSLVTMEPTSEVQK